MTSIPLSCELVCSEEKLEELELSFPRMADIALQIVGKLFLIDYNHVKCMFQKHHPSCPRSLYLGS